MCFEGFQVKKWDFYDTLGKFVQIEAFGIKNESRTKKESRRFQTSRRDPQTARREVKEFKRRKSPESINLAPQPRHRAPRGAPKPKGETRVLSQSEPLDQVLLPSLLRILEETQEFRPKPINTLLNLLFRDLSTFLLFSLSVWER